MYAYFMKISSNAKNHDSLLNIDKSDIHKSTHWLNVKNLITVQRDSLPIGMFPCLEKLHFREVNVASSRSSKLVKEEKRNELDFTDFQKCK